MKKLAVILLALAMLLSLLAGCDSKSRSDKTQTNTTTIPDGGDDVYNDITPGGSTGPSGNGSAAQTDQDMFTDRDQTTD